MTATALDIVYSTRYKNLLLEDLKHLLCKSDEEKAKKLLTKLDGYIHAHEKFEHHTIKKNLKTAIEMREVVKEKKL